MRIILLLLSSLVSVVSAHAQSFSSYMLTPVDGGFNGASPTGTPASTDLVLLNRLISPGIYSTTGLSLADFASAADIQNVNARIDQAFQQLDSNTAQLERGIAAAVALPSAFMPSAAGRTSWAVNAATFNGDIGAGFSLAHRLDASVPLAVTASYGYGGSSANVARLGLMGEF
jgi:trimeric autotransporter adhesin